MGNKSKHWTNKVNGWVFLSHSSKDYEQVKVIRDYLELNNFNAIMFYLHSYNDPTKEKQVKDLILNEIDARNIFVSCISNNADESTWVQIEKEYADNKEKIIQENIDLNNLKQRRCSELSKLDNLMTKTSIYILSPSSDQKVINTINFLSKKGFKIYEFDKIKSARKHNRIKMFEESVEEARSTNGTLIVFINEKTDWKDEVFKMMNNYNRNHSSVIFVYLNQASMITGIENRERNNIIYLHDFKYSFDKYLNLLEDQIWRNING